MAHVVQQLQDLPQLTSAHPLSWLRLEPWTPQWTPQCSWLQPLSATPSPPHATPAPPKATPADSLPQLPGLVSAALPVHAGLTRQDGSDVRSTGAAAMSMDAGSHDCITAHSSGHDIVVPSIEEQSEEVAKVCTSAATASCGYSHSAVPDGLSTYFVSHLSTYLLC